MLMIIAKNVSDLNVSKRNKLYCSISLKRQPIINGCLFFAKIHILKNSFYIKVEIELIVKISFQKSLCIPNSGLPVKSQKIRAYST